MTDTTPKPHANGNGRIWLSGAAVVLGLATLGAYGLNRSTAPDTNPESPPTPATEGPTVGSLPLFHGWPKDTKPDVALILTGETFGFLQPCGCSRPQQGGLERRAVFINSLKAKGWPIMGFDLGDLYAQKSLVPDQAKLKYKVTMNALRDMGYIAVGLGKGEFAAGIDNLIGEYALQKEQPPFILAGNLNGQFDGKPLAREERFPPIDPAKSKRPLVGLAEVAEVGGIPVGVVGIVGKSLGLDVAKTNPDLAFSDNGTVLKAALATLDAAPKKPLLNVLLYQGTSEEAKLLAKDFPAFHVILCQADDPEPPQFPVRVNDGKTLVIQVGQKGRYVGVVGAFRKEGGGFDLKYQLVPLGEEYLTPGTGEEATRANAVLPLLEAYAEQVRDRNFLAKVPKGPHASQIREPKLNLSFVGSDRCQNCHAAESVKWKETPHSHALDALEKIAKRPSLRNLDGDCVQCHVVGLLSKTGYENQKDTPQLAHVGCESCHGPGSGHSADPRAANLLALQSPWKQKPEDRLPDLATMKKIGALPAIDRGKVPLQPEQHRVINAVATMCGKCHDHENDPHFDIFTYWPKIHHTFKK